MALATLNVQDQPSTRITATTAAPGADFSQPTYGGSILKPQLTLSNGVANNLAGGADQCYYGIASIAASATLILDLTSFTNVAGQAGASLARVKKVLIRLLSVADDSGAGTACTSVTIQPDGTNGWTNLLGTGSTLKLLNGDKFDWETQSALGVAVDGTHKRLDVVNNDGVNAAAVEILVVGGST